MQRAGLFSQRSRRYAREKLAALGFCFPPPCCTAHSGAGCSSLRCVERPGELLLTDGAFSSHLPRDRRRLLPVHSAVLLLLRAGRAVERGNHAMQTRALTLRACVIDTEGVHHSPAGRIFARRYAEHALRLGEHHVM